METTIVLINSMIISAPTQYKPLLRTDAMDVVVSKQNQIQQSSKNPEEGCVLPKHIDK